MYATVWYFIELLTLTQWQNQRPLILDITNVSAGSCHLHLISHHLTPFTSNDTCNVYHHAEVKKTNKKGSHNIIHKSVAV